MTQTVRVRLRKPSRVFIFTARDITLNRNDTCIVRTDRGLEYGFCVMPGEEATPADEERHKMTVVRRASDHDDVTYRQIRMDEERAKDLCKQRIRERKLQMKLVECEYAFDRKKVIFYFTADDRVDFRELVRDLAREFKARIELRHIQVRDEAKIVGGIGSCGRELCCTTWMREFIPISMKMAKRQNLSLNPSKISGQCGRLLCCLSYENEMYQRERRPAAGADSAELGALRDEMEGHQTESLEVLRESTLADVIPPDEPAYVEEPARPGEFAAPQGADGDDEDVSNGAPSVVPQAGDRGRRRRRRGRRGGSGGAGGRGDAGPPSSAS